MIPQSGYRGVILAASAPVNPCHEPASLRLIIEIGTQEAASATSATPMVKTGRFSSTLQFMTNGTNQSGMSKRLVTARPRPVFPVQTICKIGQKLLPESAIFPKVQRSYSYFQEGDVVGKGIAAALPRDGSAVGYAVDVGFLEVYLWLPFGSRPVHRLLVSDGRQEVEAWQLKYVLVDELVLGIQGFTTMDEWTAKYGGKIVQTWHLRRLGPEAPAEKFHLVRMEPKTEHVPEPPLQMSLHTE